MNRNLFTGARPQRIGPFWFIGILSYVGGTLSLVLLMLEAFAIRSIYAPLERIVEYYIYLIDLTFGWLDPIFLAFYEQLFELFRLDIALSANWRHIFVLLLLYITSVTKVKFAKQDKDVVAELRNFALSAFVALFASSATGLADFSSQRFIDQFVICFVPILFYWMNRPLRAALKRDWKYFVNRLTTGFVRIAVSGIILAATVYALLRWSPLGADHSIGLIVLLAFIVIEASRLLAEGAMDSRRASQPLRELDTARIGMTMFSAFLGALLFLALNAGFLAAG